MIGCVICYICVHRGRGSKTLCESVLQALFYMYRITSHTHTCVHLLSDRLNLHITHMLTSLCLEVELCVFVINQ